MSANLPLASAEQRVAVDHIANGDNVILDAVAGSGKSTTVLTTVATLPEKKFLLLAFNATLRMETTLRLKKCELDKNTEVHTFHSLCYHYYNNQCTTDTEMRLTIVRRMPPRRPLPHFDVIVLDEAQDMSKLYFMWIAKFTRDAGHPFQLLILGDWRQGIYQFKGADIRCLTMADKIWSAHPFLRNKDQFHHCSLHTSFRITNTMADFVNKVMLGETRLIANKPGVPVVYYRNSDFNIRNYMLHSIHQYLRQGGHPGDIFVLAASIKPSNFTVYMLENALVMANIPCYVPNEDQGTIEDKIIQGKVVFSTFHAAKGRERPLVFVLGFDQRYFLYNAKNEPRDQCPNTLYVGCTRATKQLYVMEQQENDKNKGRPLSFLKMGHHEMQKATSFVKFMGIPVLNELMSSERQMKLQMDEEKKKQTTKPIRVTDMVKYVSENVLNQVSELMESIFILEKEATEFSFIDIPTMIPTKMGYYEDVSDINGIAIPCLYFDHMFTSCTKELEDEEGNRQARPAFQGFHISQLNHYESDSEDDELANAKATANVVSVAKGNDDKDDDESYEEMEVDEEEIEEIEENEDADAFMNDKDETYRDSEMDLDEDNDDAKDEDEEKNEDNEYHHGGSKTIMSMINKDMSKKIMQHCQLSHIPFPCQNTNDYLCLANLYIATTNKFFFKTKQIAYPHDYGWLDDSIVDECLFALDVAVGKECATGHYPIIEYDLVSPLPMANHHAKIDAVLAPHFAHLPNYKPFRIVGRADLVTSKTLWELKCTSTISIEHKLQLIVYAWLWITTNSDHPLDREFRLFNVRTGEQWRLNATYEELTLIAVILLREKITEDTMPSDAHFLDDCRDYMQQYIL